MRTFTSLLPVSMKDSKILLVLRVFSALFNLQGANRPRSAGFLLYCKPRPLSSTFFRLPAPRSHPAPLYANFYRLPRLHPVVKYFFPAPSRARRPCTLCPVRRSISIANPAELVNTKFPLFQSFLLSPRVAFLGKL